MRRGTVILALSAVGLAATAGIANSAPSHHYAVSGKQQVAIVSQRLNVVNL